MVDFRNLTVTTAATNSALTTLSQLKSDLGLGDDLDSFYQRVIDVASDEISVYLGREADDSGGVSLGRETIRETFYGLKMPMRLVLARYPLSQVVSIVENGTTTPRQITGSDGVISSGDTTLQSAGASFTSSLVGQAITITGAGASAADLTTTVASVTSATELETTAAAGTSIASAGAYAIDNPAFAYVVKKSNGAIAKTVGGVITPFTGDTITVNYVSGWILPGDTGRNLPKGIEDACILLCQHKITQLKSSANFADELKAVDIEGLGKVEFGNESLTDRANALPFDVRSILQRYVQPSFA